MYVVQASVSENIKPFNKPFPKQANASREQTQTIYQVFPQEDLTGTEFPHLAGTSGFYSAVGWIKSKSED